MLKVDPCIPQRSKPIIHVWNYCSDIIGFSTVQVNFHSVEFSEQTECYTIKSFYDARHSILIQNDFFSSKNLTEWKSALGHVHVTPFSFRSVFATNNGAIFPPCSHYSVFKQKRISFECGVQNCPQKRI